VTGVETLDFETGNDIDLTAANNGPQAVDAKVVLNSWDGVNHKLSASDADSGDSLTYKVVGATSVSGNVYTLASGAEVTLNADGTYSYDPSAKTDTDADSFTWKVTDSKGLSSQGVVSIDLAENETAVSRGTTGNDVLMGDERTIKIDGGAGDDQLVAGDVRSFPVAGEMSGISLDGGEYLGRTFSDAGSNKTWVMESWVRRDALGGTDAILTSRNGGSGTGYGWLGFGEDNRLYWVSYGVNYPTPSHYYSAVSEQVFDRPEDIGAWLNFSVAFDTTRADGNHVRLFLNGEELAQSSSSNPVPADWSESTFGYDWEHRVGGLQGAASNDFHGDIASVLFRDGATLNDADDLMLGRRQDGSWVPSSTFAGDDLGPNGFHLDFANGATPGADASSNGNDFTAYGVDGSDHLTATGLIEPALTGVTLMGGEGDDTLTGGAGSDVIDGGEGNDVLKLAGSYGDYVIQDQGDGSYAITDAAGSTDTVTGVETL
ncbi:Ig-like domain-containing protein, partial [Aestuariispira insulae]|uniref:Ig-like domain-containing protein n=1 Tax=Aestuariispira insulae TaxID=1461337 RepID=UPI001FE6F77E